MACSGNPKSRRYACLQGLSLWVEPSMNIVKSNTPNQHFTIRVFGPFTAKIDGEPVVPRTRKDLKLLAYLVMKHGQAVCRDEAANACWRPEDKRPKSKYSTPRNLLAHALSGFGNCLDEYKDGIQKPTPQSLLFCPDGIDLDLCAWEADLSGGVDELEQCAKQWRACKILDDWDDPWVQTARDSMRTKLLNTLMEAAQRFRDHRQWDDSIRCLQILFEIDPFYSAASASKHEYEGGTAVKFWLTLLYERRRFSAMRQVYNAYLRECDKCDDVPVNVSIRSCFHDLQNKAAKFGTGDSGGWIPTPISEFVNRIHETQYLCRVIAASRLTTITGVGGMGKTRLAIAVAEAAREEFYDRAWFVDLSDIARESDVQVIASKVARTLRVQPSSDTTPLERACNHLRTREILLILDNCEHLLEGSVQFANAVLHSCPDVRILVTSRVPLGIVGESVWRIPSLEYLPDSSTYHIEDVAGLAAVCLLVQRASSVQRPLVVDDSNVDAIARITRRLEGIPLAIELAAVQIERRFRSAQEVADSLDQSLMGLDEGSRGAPTRQQTLEAAIDWGYGLLYPVEKAVLERLSVFEGGFTMDAACMVCSDATRSSSLVRGAVVTLTEKSLVERRQTARGDRYYLLNAIREFAQVRLLSHENIEFGEEAPIDPESQPIETNLAMLIHQHLDYCVQFATRNQREFLHGDQSLALELQDAEIENIRVALNRTLTSATGEDAGLGVRLAGCLGWYWCTRGYFEEGTKILRRFLSVCSAAPTVDRLNLIHALGNIAYICGHYRMALRRFAQGLKIRHSIGDLASITVGRASLASALGGLNRHSEALLLYTENRRFFEGMNDLANLAISLINMGKTYGLMEEYREAKRHYTEAYVILHALNDLANMSLAANILGDVDIRLGDYLNARARLREALSLALKIGNRPRVVLCLIHWVSLAIALARFEPAAVLSGYIVAFSESIAFAPPKGTWDAHMEDLGSVRTALGEGLYCDLYARGEKMTEKQIIAFINEQLRH